MAKLNLTVIRSADIHIAVKFYRLLGLEFEIHSHGNGPKHYATMDTDSVFEIYPATEKFPATLGTRIGFKVDDCESVSQMLISSGYKAHLMPEKSPWGMRAVFSDPDGHKVEVTS